MGVKATHLDSATGRESVDEQVFEGVAWCAGAISKVVAAGFLCVPRFIHLGEREILARAKTSCLPGELLVSVRILLHPTASPSQYENL